MIEFIAEERQPPPNKRIYLTINTLRQVISTATNWVFLKKGK